MNLQSNTEMKARFTISEDGQTVKDAKTGLVWERKHLDRMTWDQAKEASKIAKQVSRHGYSNWRVPTKAELASVVDLSNGPTVDHDAFPECPRDRFWTSETFKPHPSLAWQVNFNIGSTVAELKSGTGFVRLVRSGH